LGILLQQGIGDTIRISLTPSPCGKRSEEAEACKLLLQTMNFRSFRPMVTSCPGCGRTSSDLYQKLAEDVNRYIDEKLPEWKTKYPAVVNLKIAVMGCVVNGPGESKMADIGICLPGRSEKPIAQVYKNQNLFKTLEGNNISKQFTEILEEFVPHYSSQ